MKLFVWHGPAVLKNYTSGLVVIAAETREQAWSKLREADCRAFYWLKTGVKHVFSEAEWEFCKEEQEDFYQDWVVIEPKECDISELPVFVQYGGE